MLIILDHCVDSKTCPTCKQMSHGLESHVTHPSLYHAFNFINSLILLAKEPNPLFKFSGYSKIQLLITILEHLPLDQV